MILWKLSSACPNLATEIGARAVPAGQSHPLCADVQQPVVHASSAATAAYTACVVATACAWANIEKWPPAVRCVPTMRSPRVFPHTASATPVGSWPSIHTAQEPGSGDVLHTSSPSADEIQGGQDVRKEGVPAALVDGQCAGGHERWGGVEEDNAGQPDQCAAARASVMVPPRD